MTDFGLVLAGSLPRVKIVSATAEPLGQPLPGGGGVAVSKVSVHLKNYGYMPTNCSDQGVNIGAIRPQALATLSNADENDGQVVCLSGGLGATAECPHLQGRMQQRGNFRRAGRY